MKKTLTILILLAFAGFAAYWSAGHHLLRTEEGYAVLEKRLLSFKDTFVDIRGWTADNFKAHPELKQALKKQGYSDFLTRGLDFAI